MFQVEQKRQEQWEQQRWLEQEKEKENEACRIQEDQLRLEVQRMAEKGYEERVSQWW